MSHIASFMQLVKLTEMEVVVLGVAERNQEANDVDERCARSVSCLICHDLRFGSQLLSSQAATDVLTPSGWVLAHVLLCVASEKTLGLRLGSWATGQLLVEVDDLLHADGIGGRADGLVGVSALVVFGMG